MTTDTTSKTDDTTTDAPDEDAEDQTTDTGQPDEDEESTDKPEVDPEVAKWQRKAARRDRELRKAQEELATLRKAKEGGDEAEDKDAKANAKLIRASARSVLAAAGVVDKEAQATVLQYLNLSDVSVDDAGDPDEDEIQERVDALREAFGGAAPKETRRTPRLDTRDKGGKTSTVDPDTARYRQILRQG